MWKVTTTHIWMWQLPSEKTCWSLCRLHQITYSRNVSFSNVCFVLKLKQRQFCIYSGHEEQVHLPEPVVFAWKHGWNRKKSCSQNLSLLSLTPNVSLKNSHPWHEIEERAGFSLGPCGILSTVECPPRPNPRPPSSRPHPPPSWSGAHTVDMARTRAKFDVFLILVILVILVNMVIFIPRPAGQVPTQTHRAS